MPVIYSKQRTRKDGSGMAEMHMEEGEVTTVFTWERDKNGVTTMQENGSNSQAVSDLMAMPENA